MSSRLRHLASRLLLSASLLLGSLSLNAATLADFAGTYEALLRTPTVEEPMKPFGRIEVTAASTGKVSGKLTVNNGKTYGFSGNLEVTVDDEARPVGGEDIVAVKGPFGMSLVLIDFTLGLDGSFEVNGLSMLENFSGHILHVPGSAGKIASFAKLNPCPWAGAYTVAFSDPETEDARDFPGGAGYGSVVIAPTGVLTLKGKLGDGTKITASAKPSADGRYRLSLNPYKTAGSYFNALFQLTQRADDKYHVADGEAAEVSWQKAENSKDKAYPLGFGPLDLFLTLAPWEAPAKGETLAQQLTLGGNQVFEIGLGNALPAARSPSQLGLTAKNTFRVAAGKTGSPSALDVAAWSKIFSGKIDPKTGIYTAVLNLEDLVSGKTVKRKVTIEGVLFQTLTYGDFAIAQGLVLVPPLAPATTITSLPTTFEGPFVTDALFASAAATAGNYQALLEMLEPGTAAPSGIPADGELVDVSISSDLTSLTFFGRKIPLSGDSRPTSLVFSDAAKNIRNNLTVTVHLNVATGVVIGLSANYYQIAGSFPPEMRVRTFTSDTVTKLP